MRRYPLYESHPQFSVFESNGCCEYRVENWRLSRNGNGKIVRGASVLTLQDAVLFILLNVFFWPMRYSNRASISVALVFCVYLYKKCTQVLYESVVIVPPHGVQLETYRGLPGLRLLATRRFIRLAVLQDIIIHEGLKGWNVHYHLVVVKATKPGVFALELAFQNLLPQQSVLVYVYRGIHTQLFGRKSLRRTKIS